MSKHKDLHPWLDYFEMLHQYEQQGFLEMKQDKHEAYVTRAALHAMTPGDNPVQQIENDIFETVRRLRAYAAYISLRSGWDYNNAPFAIHVVQEEPPHDLLYTLLLTRRRRWFSPWKKSDCIEVISYNDKPTK